MTTYIGSLRRWRQIDKIPFRPLSGKGIRREDLPRLLAGEDRDDQPASLLRLVVSAANNLAAGRAVMAIPTEVALTPAEAAELLGLSRPFVARLLERGDIPSEFMPDSRHRRVRLEDVLAFQDRRERRSEGRRRIADIAAEPDLPYLCLLVAEADGPDPDDNVHMAAAVAAQVELLVTWNGKDFDCGFSRKNSLRIVSPDACLCALYEELPDEVLATITRLAASKRRPPLTPDELVNALDRAGVNEFASRVRQRLTEVPELPADG